MYAKQDALSQTLRQMSAEVEGADAQENPAQKVPRAELWWLFVCALISMKKVRVAVACRVLVCVSLAAGRLVPAGVGARCGCERLAVGSKGEFVL